jgi:hypothetical protein
MTVESNNDCAALPVFTFIHNWNMGVENKWHKLPFATIYLTSDHWETVISQLTVSLLFLDYTPSWVDNFLSLFSSKSITFHWFRSHLLYNPLETVLSVLNYRQTVLTFYVPRLVLHIIITIIIMMMMIIIIISIISTRLITSNSPTNQSSVLSLFSLISYFIH